jgi:phage terminase Nu1 subunit (DNA packaging protein)
MPEIVDALDLAERLRVKPATVLAWARRGWIPCLRAGRRPVLFDLAEVQKVLKERAAQKGDGHAV